MSTEGKAATGDDGGTATQPDLTNEIHAMALFKMPPFLKVRPTLWLSRVERQFRLYNVRSDAVKFDKVITGLDHTVFMQVEPLRPSRRTEVTPTIANNPPPKREESEQSSTKQQQRFTPRSTAMQLALNKVEFSCPEAPLDDFRAQKKFNDDDLVSEAGTYTVDGDNYTEEQKEQMNIDKKNALLEKQLQLHHLLPNQGLHRYHQNELEQLLTDTGQCRPTDLPLQLSSSIENCRRNNILEISYYHESTSLNPKTSYLEKIKSRVKSITKASDKQDSSADRGTFTSVTTSGVLSKKPSLDSRPRVHRKSSLTKSYIDSSEYVSADASVKSNDSDNMIQNYPNPAFTDHEKAEYKLNVFGKQAEFSSQYQCTSPLHTPQSSPDMPGMPDATVLKTAHTKHDWIQEWARNARARSAASTKTSNAEQMSRSFNCENSEDSMLSDSLSYQLDRNDRCRNHGMTDFEYDSDNNLASRKMFALNDNTNSIGIAGNLTVRPPISPSKIPSPVHTVGRVRTANRTRGSLQDLSPNAFTPDTDIYLHKTAVAISNLAQNLSRKNSLQNSPTSNTTSPQRIRDIYQPSHQSHQYSADEYSPARKSYHQQGLHKRNLSQGDYRTNLITHSLNSDQLNRMLVDYRNKQQLCDRDRQNSFDASIYSPRQMYVAQPLCQHLGNYIEQTNSSIKHQQETQSPIRRSSSFSSKVHQLGRSKNQLFANKAIQSRATLANKSQIQKSASSISFRKMNSDYDDDLEYYINDEDDLVNEYCSSDEFDDSNEHYRSEALALPLPEPVTNTRYNKALLMRIECSKIKVTGNNATTSSTQSKHLMGGSMACPNTPEMPRRSAQNVFRSSMRQSVPRDSSLSRLRGEIPNSLASAKKQLLQTASSQNTPPTKNVQPKYMDISKYKTNQTGNFLRKDGSKITLAPTTGKNEIKRSPSSASVVLNRSDSVRVSNRSVKSAGGKPSVNNVVKQKENELAMWRRRATYDPMKAAAEGRRKQEEAKKSSQAKYEVPDSSTVSRSQSFHSDVGKLATNLTAKNQQYHGKGGNEDLIPTIDDSVNSIDDNEIGDGNGEYDYGNENGSRKKRSTKASTDSCQEFREGDDFDADGFIGY